MTENASVGHSDDASYADIPIEIKSTSEVTNKTTGRSKSPDDLREEPALNALYESKILTILTKASVDLSSE